MPTTMNTWTRVIVLTPSPFAAGTDDVLKAQFAARDWFAVEQRDPCLAMAELCLREKAQTARSAWGLQRMEQIAIVIRQPDHWRNHGVQLDEMIAAIKKYIRNASVWQAIDDELLPIHAAATASPTRNAAAIANAGGSRNRDSVGNRDDQSAPLRIARLDRTALDGTTPAMTPSRNPKAIEAHDSLSSVSLTRQEIDMLLDSKSPIFGSEAAS